MQATIPRNYKPALNGGSAAHKVNDQCNHANHQQQMNQAAGNVERQKRDKPDTKEQKCQNQK